MPPRKRKAVADEHVHVGLKFVKKFKDGVGYEGTVKTLGHNRGMPVAHVFFEDGDDEVLPTSEINEWLQKGLESTFTAKPKTPGRGQRPKGTPATPKTPKSTAKVAPPKLVAPAALEDALPKTNDLYSSSPPADVAASPWVFRVLVLVSLLATIYFCSNPDLDRSLRWRIWPLMSGAVMVNMKALLGL